MKKGSKNMKKIIGFCLLTFMLWGCSNQAVSDEQLKNDIQNSKLVAETKLNVNDIKIQSEKEEENLLTIEVLTNLENENIREKVVFNVCYENKDEQWVYKSIELESKWDYELLKPNYPNEEKATKEIQKEYPNADSINFLEFKEDNMIPNTYIYEFEIYEYGWNSRKEIVAEVSYSFEFIENDNLLGKWVSKINQTSMNMHRSY